MNYKILEEYETAFLIQCNVCGEIFTYSKANLHKFRHSPLGGHCIRTLQTRLREKYGDEPVNKFFRIMRGAKNRVTNPRNKDYPQYSKYSWGFRDGFDFYNAEFQNYLNAIEKYGYECLSIDRIDGNKGYERGNIRWVPMSVNLQNKERIKPVRCFDHTTQREAIWENARQCGLAIGIEPTRVWEACKRSNHLYNKRYEFSYMERSND